VKGGHCNLNYKLANTLQKLKDWKELQIKQ
jgi:hypothetical protein